MITLPCPELWLGARMVCKSAAKGQFWGSNSDKNFWNFRLQLVTPKSSSCKAHGTRSSLKSCPIRLTQWFICCQAATDRWGKCLIAKHFSLPGEKNWTHCRFTAACILDSCKFRFELIIARESKTTFKTTFMQEFNLRTNSQWRVSLESTRLWFVPAIACLYWSWETLILIVPCGFNFAIVSCPDSPRLQWE